MVFSSYKKKRAIRKSPKSRRRLGASPMVATALRVGRKIAKYAPRALKAYKSFQNFNQRVVPDGNGSSFSNFMRKWKPLGLARNILSQNECQRWQQISTTPMISPSGLQVIQTFDCTSNSSLLSIVSKIQSALATGASNVNSLVGTVGTVGGPVNTLVYALKQIKNTIIFTNNTNTTAFLDLYEFCARQDTVQGAQTAFSQGISDASNSSVGFGSYGITPFQSPTFCAEFKILSVKHIELSAGRTHKHSMIFDSNVEINAERIITGAYTKGVGCGCMAIAYGIPCDSVNSTVGISAVQLDCVQQREYLFGYGVNNSKLFTYGSSTLTTTLQKTVNVNDGLAELFTIA